MRESRRGAGAEMGEMVSAFAAPSPTVEGKYDVFLRPPSAEGKNRDAAALILAELERRGGKLDVGELRAVAPRPSRPRSAALLPPLHGPLSTARSLETPSASSRAALRAKRWSAGAASSRTGPAPAKKVVGLFASCVSSSRV